LSSETFQRAPGVAQVLSYVCEQYFAGDAAALKEYSIAVDALHRPADFNQKNDSIVRVEMLRLRKKLQQYYETEGADHAIRITVPKGQYTPQFIYAGNLAEAAELPAQPSLVAAVEWSPEQSLTIRHEPSFRETDLSVRGPGTGHRPWRWVWALVVVALAVISWQANRVLRNRQASSSTIAGATQSNIRIQAGSPGIRINPLGILWSGDRYFTGGKAVRMPVKPVANTIDPDLFTTAREGTFRYDIPVQPGVYEVHLHFAERTFGENSERGGGEASRQFLVKLNGATILPGVDIFSDAGGQDIAHERVFRDVQPAKDSKVHLEFVELKEGAVLNGIEVVPGTKGKCRTIRIVAGNGSVMDSEKHPWGSDRYFKGGQVTQRPETVQGSRDPQLFQAERYGHFTYTIPVDPKGRYRVNMMFSERWFGPGRPGWGGGGSRRFDIYCNGVALARNLDIFELAGGSNRAVARTFSNLEPSAAGQLVLSFVPSANYASINAIEVVEQ
jgi:Malectin domain